MHEPMKIRDNLQQSLPKISIPIIDLAATKSTNYFGSTILPIVALFIDENILRKKIFVGELASLKSSGFTI